MTVRNLGGALKQLPPCFQNVKEHWHELGDVLNFQNNVNIPGLYTQHTLNF